MDKKKIITDVLFNFYNVNLASDSAREWIASEIIKKLDNPEHKTQDLYESQSTQRGIFEEYLSSGQQQKELEKQQESFRNQSEQKVMEVEKEVVQTKKEVEKKPKKIKPKRTTPIKKTKTKNLKNLRKPRGKFL